MKIIKIFLASSIDDLADDRVKVGDFFTALNNIYLERDIFFKLIKCENYDSALAKEGKQTEYDEEIRNSDLVFFLFFKKAGKYTKHEFEVALEKFKEADKPKIVTYFKQVEDGEDIIDEVKAFMQMLDTELNHYYKEYKNIDMLKLSMLMQIKLMQLDASDFKIMDGKIYFNGGVIASVDNIPMFSKNDDLKAKKDRLAEILPKYYELQEKYMADKSDMEAYKAYSEVASEKAELEESIRAKEKEIFGIAENITEKTAKGGLSRRQKRGYHLLERGDYDRALEVLDPEEIYAEMEHNSKLADNMQQRLQTNVDELLLRIEALKAKGITTESVKEICEIYERACEETRKHNLDKDVFYKHAEFLYKQKDYYKAVEVAKELEYYYSNPREQVEEDKIARLYNLLGLLYQDLNCYSEAEEMYKKDIEITERLVAKNPEAYEGSLAMYYNNIGWLYYKTNRYSEAEEMYKKAIEIKERLAAKHPEAYEGDLANSYNNIGVLYEDLNRYSEAEEMYKKAIEIKERLAAKHPEAYEGDLATIYDNIGNLYYKTNRYSEAEEMYKKDIEIRKRLAAKHPEAYEDSLATSYNNIGNLYGKTNRYSEAEEMYKKAIEIRERLAAKHPEAYEGDLAISYNNIGNLYDKTNRYSEAEEMYKKAIEISERLATKHPEAYELFGAISYNNIGSLYYKTNRYSEAEEEYKKAIEIRERLAAKHPEAYEGSLANSYNNIGYLYEKMGRRDEANEMFKKAKALRQKNES